MRLIAAGCCVLAVTIGVRASAEQKTVPPALSKNVGELTAQEEEEFSKAAESTIERVCILCHPFENIVKTRRTVREWNDQVTVMAQRGAPGNDADFTLAEKYLTRYYGIVSVNTATAEELSSVLGLSPKAAGAVLEYRKANGRIPDLATFLKIEGVDKVKIDEQPEALRFD